MALETYKRRSLQPLIDAMGDGEASYLRAMVSVMDDRHVAGTGDVARALGKAHRQVAPYRQALIGDGIIIAVGRGEVRFNIPYLRGYLSKTLPGSPDERLAREWDV